ncbi:hypothetical protein EIK77_005114 [Talaromyces pinophilus]|nr:hypothetical protein EIK77_005114 [Talaromyces pinophilus]
MDYKHDNAHIVQHPFTNILRVSEQVCKEAVDILYGENTFVYTWKENRFYWRSGWIEPPPFIITEENRSRMRSQQYHICCYSENYVCHYPEKHISCELEKYGHCYFTEDDDCASGAYCELYMTICPGSIHFYVDMIDDLWGFEDSGLVPNILCEELFDRLWIIFQRMAPPQLTSAEVFVASHLLDDAEMMYSIECLCDSYVYEGYQIHEAS